jgi:ABC-type dipeptide/oligopeptide/nickel transport system permease component
MFFRRYLDSTLDSVRLGNLHRHHRRVSSFRGCCPTTRFSGRLPNYVHAARIWNPGSMDKIIADMTEMYGLEGSVLRSVLGVLGAPAARGFGRLVLPVSHAGEPLIATRCLGPQGLLLTTTLLAWIVGNLAGRVCWLFLHHGWSHTVDAFAMVIRPMPYYIFAFALLLLFAYVVRWFPISGGATWVASRDSPGPCPRRAVALLFACAFDLRDPGQPPGSRP